MKKTSICFFIFILTCFLGRFFDKIKQIFGGVSGVIITVLIIAIAMYAMYIILTSSISARSKIKQLKNAFSKYENIDAESLNDLTSEFETEDAREIWKKFKDNLVRSKNKVGEDVFCTIYPIKDFFNLNLIGGELVSSKLIPVIPSILTGLGLLGTFWGLTTGLSGVDIHDAEKMTSSIDKIISGASTAFITSLVGIALSLIVNITEKFAIHYLKSQLLGLRNILYPLFPLVKLEETFIQIASYNKNMNESIGELAERIGNKMQEGMIEASSKMTSDISNALDKLISSTQSWGERVANGSEGVLSNLISEFNDRIGANAESQREMLRESADKMSNIVSSLDDMLRKYSDATNENIQNVQKQQEEANKQHMDNLNSYNNKLAEATEEVFKNQEKQSEMLYYLLDKCSSVATGLAAEFDELKTNIITLNTKITSIINRFDASIEKLEGATENLSNTGNVFQEAGEKFAGPIKQIVSSFESVADKTLQAHAKIEEISQNLADTTSESDEMLNSINVLLKNSNGTFNELSKQQNVFLSQLKENLSNLHKEVVVSFENYKDSIANQTNNRLEQWNEKTNQFSSAMLNTVRTIQAIVDDIEKKID